MRYSGEENIAKKTFIPTDVAICFTCKIFAAIIYTLVRRIIVCLFISFNWFIVFRLKLFWFTTDDRY